MTDLLEKDKTVDWLFKMTENAKAMAMNNKNELMTIKLYAQAAAFAMIYNFILEDHFDVEDITNGVVN